MGHSREAVKVVKDPNNDPGSTVSSADPSSTSLSLLDGLKTRDPAAWRRLAQLYGPLVYRWCRRRGLQANDCEDVVQEVFLTVANRVTDFRREKEGDSFRGWLWTITRNKLGDWIRRQRDREKAVGGQDTPGSMREATVVEIDASASAEASADMGRLYHRALDLIRTEFEERSWLAFWRVVVEGRSPADVSAELAMTRNAVYIARSRILHRLREVLGEG